MTYTTLAFIVILILLVVVAILPESVLKVEIIVADDDGSLQDQINAFIRKKAVSDIKPVARKDSKFSVMVLYK